MADSVALLDAFEARHPERIRWKERQSLDYGLREVTGVVIALPSGGIIGRGVCWPTGNEPSDARGIIARSLKRKLKRWLRAD